MERSNDGNRKRFIGVLEIIRYVFLGINTFTFLGMIINKCMIGIILSFLAILVTLPLFLYSVLLKKTKFGEYLNPVKPEELQYSKPKNLFIRIRDRKEINQAREETERKNIEAENKYNSQMKKKRAIQVISLALSFVLFIMSFVGYTSTSAHYSPSDGKYTEAGGSVYVETSSTEPDGQMTSQTESETTGITDDTTTETSNTETTSRKQEKSSDTSSETSESTSNETIYNNSGDETTKSDSAVTPQTDGNNKETSTSSGTTVSGYDGTEENLVWIPTNGGRKYHTNPNCSNMIDPVQVTESTAISRGYTKCKKCY